MRIVLDHKKDQRTQQTLTLDKESTFLLFVRISIKEQQILKGHWQKIYDNNHVLKIKA